MRRMVVLTAFVLCGCCALAQAMDVEALQERLAAQDARMAEQDARMNDLQAKIMTSQNGGAAEGVVSLRKNAVVSVGGLVTTRYSASRAKIDSSVDLQENPKPWGRLADAKYGDLKMNDVEISMQIEVNDHFDAFVTMDLQNGANDDYNVAKVYYVRWKNICDSGFGLKVGRDALVFGQDGVGELASYAAGSGDGLGEMDFGIGESFIMPHNGWDMDGVVQVTPYWEGLDGKLSFELSFIQNVYNDGPYMELGAGNSMIARRRANGEYRFRSRNYGIGSMSARATYMPIEGLTLSAGFVNFHSNGNDALFYDENGDYLGVDMHNKNNTAMALSFNYTPCFMDRLTIWSQWVHGWNVDNMDGYDSDAVNFGASYDLTDRLTIFAQGDYLRGKMDFSDRTAPYHYNFRGKAWAAYAGAIFDLGHGATLEAGWKREWTTLKEYGATIIKARADTVYAQLGFEF